MANLFPIDVRPEDIPSIPGLSYYPNYITPAEQAELVRLIDAETWDTTWERRRQLYGATYGPGDPSSERPIPDWGARLAERMHQEGISEWPFDQMLVNEYEPGQGIALHYDHKPFDRTVVSLSLLLEPRSLLVLSDQARYDWQHGIARRKNDRWQGIVIPRRRRLSVTFRRRK